MLLVVVEDLLNGLDSRVSLTRVILVLVVSLVPVQDSTNEGGDQGDLGLSTSDGLAETEQEGKVAVDVLLLLEVSSGLDTSVGRSNLDKNSVLVDTDGLVECDKLLSLGDGGLGVKRKRGVNLGGNSTGDDLEDLSAELDELKKAGSGGDSE